MKVLVSAATRHGSTVEIAASIGAALQAAGLETYILAPSEVDGFAGYDAAVIGSGVYVGKWLEPARDLVEHHKSELLAIPVWLFSSGPVGEPPKPAEDPADALALVDLVHARGHRTIPGAVDKKKLGFGERAVMAAVRAPEGDFRPWDEISAWAQEIAASLGVASHPTGSSQGA